MLGICAPLKESKRTVSITAAEIFHPLKRNISAKKYGQQEYDFDEGIIFYCARGQVFSIERDANATG